MQPYELALHEALKNPILDAVQQAKLTQIVEVLHRWDLAAETIVAGLMDVREWPGSTLCLYPIRLETSVLRLTASQLQRLDRLRPPDLALSVLDLKQRTQVEAFKTAVELVREAIGLKLIPAPPKGEPLCQ